MYRARLGPQGPRTAPGTAAESADEDASAARPSTYADGVRLVLADNDDGALDLIALDLGLEGHDIVGLARSGEEAVAQCEAHRPEVLVVDYRMPPGIDGVEGARRVLAGGRGARVIISS